MSLVDNGCSGVFEEPEDGFADDDLLSSEDISVSMDGVPLSRSFLEREDFESELGSVDPFEEDFTSISMHNIVEVIADGDRVGRPIVVIYAYRLPSNKSLDHAQLLRYLQSILEKVVDLDYTIVYFHYGLRSHNKPPIKWLFQAYKVLDRSHHGILYNIFVVDVISTKGIRKALFVVHPTRFIRILWSLFRPLISGKFEDKFHYVNCINELEQALSVSRLNLPQPIREHDSKISSSSGESRPSTPPTLPRPTQQFDVTLEFILAHHPNHDVPPIVSDLIEFLERHALDIEGIFRKSANVGSIRRLQDRVNKGMLSDLLYIFSKISFFFSDSTSILFKCVLQVAANSKVNLMNANNLSVVFGPNLTWPTDQQVPVAQLHNLNNFCYRLIVDYDKIFS
uniref:CRAL-TRIO domain-containing protein n=1 Tax=Heterorhabditis bacteriophora TaxID=37862 RepID=A0A1I7WWA8_HETBA